ncbi:DNA gyrase subunit A [Dietzia cinnamea]|uniref:DNA gyrase subunit A n=1 Tax=Dietzia cinnamea TaxID=321318 RepID=UPI00223B0729|nr:DNA gyrase subunit A [Dietzia cinnamea]MCT2061338.1 DNA gyrase subunit A [Dietzia cinnamea]MCT2235328.1 DNA gyrase subunit A [Dietzia cinnamea]MCT2300717.1 DNA gyrase subunit A [Dietzia cinnamea]
MGAAGAIGGWFEPSDEVGRAWDEAEAILRACDDLDAVMVAIHDAASPVEARRALKRDFGFTGRQAALLLTLPVLSFTRSERERLAGGRRARLELLADVTGVLPAVPADGDVSEQAPAAAAEPAHTESAHAEPAHQSPPPAEVDPAAPVLAGPDDGWSAEFDGAFARISGAMAASWGDAAPDPAPADDLAAPRDPAPTAAAPVGPSRPGRRSAAVEQDAWAVLDEQIGELCDALAELLRVPAPAPAVVAVDDPRSSDSPSGVLLDGSGVDDETGIRTLLWHLRRTGLDSVEGLLPFAEPLTTERGFDVQAARYEDAMGAGVLGFEQGGDATWAGRLWPIAERSGFGYAVSYRGGPDAGSVWAYGGGQPLHRLWDSVVDLLVELYQAFTAGAPCDSALAAVAAGRVVWTNLG